jgi:hypothetical protein
MQQRRDTPDVLDYYPTPPWAVRAFCRYVLGLPAGQRSPMVVWDPACGGGHMARPLSEACETVLASDVFDHGFGGVRDFLACDAGQGPAGDFSLRIDGAGRSIRLTGLDAAAWIDRVDMIVTNPPFALAEQFIHRALVFAPRVAVLVRTAFFESEGRYERLYATRPPERIAQFVQRVPMHQGHCPRWVWKAEKGRWERASTASAYAWMVWSREHVGDPTFGWIPPCRQDLEVWGDYDDDLGPERAGPPPLPMAA